MGSTIMPTANPFSTNDHICFICNSILIRPHDKAAVYEESVERSGADIAKSIEASCRLYTMMGEILKIRHFPLSRLTIKITPSLITINSRTAPRGPETSLLKNYRRIDYVVQDEAKNKGLEIIEIALLPTDATFRKHPDFPLSLSTNSNLSFKFIKRCLSFCRRFHEFYNSSQGPRLPTQLVDVGDTDSQRPRVVITLRQEIPIGKTSKTFQDAFTTTHRLGFHYVWVNSLYIMQDHQRKDGWQDWLTESARMGDNYKHAALTIAPTPTVDKANEFFSDRDMAHRIPLAVNIV
ncbi:hypothetical protein BKA59DRAFT_66719 [Fusarium tricinctum]|uniref:Heterokaryon incompatibility domain-containing protein n=1 Tax=Fusarium tricinctum TaxID=61284 RepID=A0A8K0RLQ2_9HYPO|nr:hypothetical protein BKA59DRAFT_66727 [Fusarium tricinctum]KAH7230315.1 hypothetical protein BKA59DRAFT_66719 [Fusarium tricinctum]